jgi:uncharacterized membrane protein YkvA (DUF1232 family)
MKLPIARVRMILGDVPKQGKLAYCLLRDDRVPRAPKLVLLGALAVIVGPLDFPAWIPVLGELDMLALGVLAVKVFVDACPEELVREQEARLKRGESAFDHDIGALTRLVRRGSRRVVAEIQDRMQRRRVGRRDRMQEETA